MLTLKKKPAWTYSSTQPMEIKLPANSGEKLVVGRDQKKVDLTIDSCYPFLISRVHATFVCQGNSVTMTSEALNGTLVNGTRKREAELKEGDELVFGGAGGIQEGESVAAPVSELVYIYSQSNKEEASSEAVKGKRKREEQGENEMAKTTDSKHARTRSKSKGKQSEVVVIEDEPDTIEADAPGKATTIEKRIETVVSDGEGEEEEEEEEEDDGSYTVNVISPEGNLKVTCNEAMTIAAFKKEIAKLKPDFAPSRQRLIYFGQELKSGTIGSKNVTEGNSVHLAVRPVGV